MGTEAYMAADRTPYHIKCLKCYQCKKKLNPSTLNEHQKQLYCRNCYEANFVNREDDIPDRTVMQVLPIGGNFYKEPKPVVPEILSEEELRKRREAEEAAKAWQRQQGPAIRTSSGCECPRLAPSHRTILTVSECTAA